VQVRIGQVVDVALQADNGMDPWQVTNPDPAILAPTVNPAAAAARGVTLRAFQAVGVGTAKIDATDRPTCSPGQACPRLIRAFTATVVVTSGSAAASLAEVAAPTISPPATSPSAIPAAPAPASPSVVPVAKPSAPAPAAPTGQSTVTITNADEGSTIHVRTGTTVVLALKYDSGMQSWSVEAPDPAVLVPAAAPPPAPGTTTQAYRAAAGGTAAIMATDRAACNPGQACPRFVVAFRATVVVDPA
jgi:predicted secreted protein